MPQPAPSRPTPPRSPAVPPFDLSGLTTCSLYDRPSKVALDDLGRPEQNDAAGDVFGRFLDSLPKQLAADALRRLVRHLVRVRAEGRVAVAALGGHVIKTGCAPYLIRLAEQGVLAGFALNGAAAIHDAELALAGKTSEDVGPRLLDGTFGMAAETAELYAAGSKVGSRTGVGLGRALGDELLRRDAPHNDVSILAAAARLNLPCTVHVGVGTDVVHMHPVLSGADLGGASHFDFRILTTVISRMAGGVWLNLGCAVLLPEVFLKIVSIVHNFGGDLDGLVTANLDMIQQYRGRVNVCQRPSEEGLALTGHHELMIPLVEVLVSSAAAAAGLPAAPFDWPALLGREPHAARRAA